MSRTIRFAKMQGIGNDFIALHSDWLGALDPGAAAPDLCNRHTGIGADGLIVIGASPNPSCAFDFAMFNPDGTPDMCGNGLRCAVLLAYRTGLLPIAVKEFTVTTRSGIHSCRCLDLSPDLRYAQVRIEMGLPAFAPQDIPLDLGVLRLIDHSLRLPIDHETFLLNPVNTGTTHCVIYVDELPSDELFFRVSPQMEAHPAFPERTSILWTKRADAATFDIRIWERGAGETLGCGTGACAVAATAIATGRASHGFPIDVRSKGGMLRIDWPSSNAPVLMSGPAILVFDGRIPIEFGR